MAALLTTNLQLPNQQSFYKGKVREVYEIANHQLVMVATDRLSAFDVVLPQGIPYKGQILNQLATEMLQSTASVVPNWLIDTPDPNVSIGHKCSPFKVEMVIRAYLAGHAYREYKAGKRSICGVNLPDGLKENDKLPQPIITPTTKADQGDHDEDISREAILENGIVEEKDYLILEDYTRKLFQKGTEIADERGLILVDTKYEFGKTKEGKIVVIDEIHTPDSSRFFYKDTYEELQQAGKKQRQLSKEFVREYLISQGFQGKENQEIPRLSNDFIESVSQRYIELYEKITGKKFEKAPQENIDQRIQQNLNKYFR
ncbi:MAG: phosphoribosylaminoimidazolesuccinocarboxamide synthase [Bacteroidota bacterium]